MFTGHGQADVLANVIFIRSQHQVLPLAIRWATSQVNGDKDQLWNPYALCEGVEPGLNMSPVHPPILPAPRPSPAWKRVWLRSIVKMLIQLRLQAIREAFQIVKRQRLQFLARRCIPVE